MLAKETRKGYSPAPWGGGSSCHCGSAELGSAERLCWASLGSTAPNPALGLHGAGLGFSCPCRETTGEHGAGRAERNWGLVLVLRHQSFPFFPFPFHFPFPFFLFPFSFHFPFFPLSLHFPFYFLFPFSPLFHFPLLSSFFLFPLFPSLIFFLLFPTAVKKTTLTHHKCLDSFFHGSHPSCGQHHTTRWRCYYMGNILLSPAWRSQSCFCWLYFPFRMRLLCWPGYYLHNGAHNHLRRKSFPFTGTGDLFIAFIYIYTFLKAVH